MNDVITSNVSHLTLDGECSFSWRLRSEGIRKGIKFWIKRLLINSAGELDFRGTHFISSTDAQITKAAFPWGHRRIIIGSILLADRAPLDCM